MKSHSELPSKGMSRRAGTIAEAKSRMGRNLRQKDLSGPFRAGG